MFKFLITFKTLLLAAVMATSMQAQAAEDRIKVVYHLNEGLSQASRAMLNIKYHLTADPQAKIVVVAHGDGVEFMLEGAKSSSGAFFAGAVGDLANQGVEFRVCENTLNDRKISHAQLLMEAKVVPSGVAEVARLQAREGFVYLRP